MPATLPGSRVSRRKKALLGELVQLSGLTHVAALDRQRLKTELGEGSPGSSANSRPAL